MTSTTRLQQPGRPSRRRAAGEPTTTARTTAPAASRGGTGFRPPAARWKERTGRLPGGQWVMTRVLRRILSGSWETAQWPPSRMRLNLRELEGWPLVKAEGSEAWRRPPTRLPTRPSPPAQTFHAHWASTLPSANVPCARRRRGASGWPRRSRRSSGKRTGP